MTFREEKITPGGWLNTHLSNLGINIEAYAVSLLLPSGSIEASTRYLYVFEMDECSCFQLGEAEPSCLAHLSGC